VSEMVATSAASIHIFTENNIAPRGDLASRALKVHLEVDRTDPENREFKHSDPIAWTEAHRGEILVALYTILLGNPTLKEKRDAPMKTRFKMWWRVVGSAVEHAAAVVAAGYERPQGLEAEEARKEEVRRPQPIDFKDVFLEQEEEDEESLGLGHFLAVLLKVFKGKKFAAADVAGLINVAGDAWKMEETAIKLGVSQEDVFGYGQAVREFLFPRAQGDSTLPFSLARRTLQAATSKPW